MSVSKHCRTDQVEDQTLDNNQAALNEKSLADFPNEVLQVIFKFLSGKDLLTNRLVNKRWLGIINEVIEKKISSGFIKPMPAIKAGGRPCDRLKVHISSTPFRENGFPFKSLLLNGKLTASKLPNIPDISKAFFHPTASVGRNLTSLGLSEMDLSFTNLRKALNSSPHLKILHLSNIKVIDDFGKIEYTRTLPAPPDLQNLKILELISDRNLSDELIRLIFSWLTFSYANQVVCLKISTLFLFPSFRRPATYRYLKSGQFDTVFATTSNSAFEKLTELKIMRPSNFFLRLSNTPALKRLTISDLPGDDNVGLENVMEYISKHSATLQQVHLNIYLNDQSMLKLHRFGRSLTKMPKLTSFAINFPKTVIQRAILFKDILVVFPNLEFLHFVAYGPGDDSIKFKPASDDEESDSDIGELNQIDALEERLVALQRKRREIRKAKVLSSACNMSLEEINTALETVEREGASVERKFTALGGNLVGLEVQEMLNLNEIWHKSNLQMVSVSSSGQPDGDVCIIRKGDRGTYV